MDRGEQMYNGIEERLIEYAKAAGFKL